MNTLLKYYTTLPLKNNLILNLSIKHMDNNSF